MTKTKNKSKHPSTYGTTNLTRARFGPGMLLQHEDLELLNDYPRDVMRLLVQKLFGCGVVCGLKVVATPDGGKLRIKVESGMALDGAGDPIWVPNAATVMVGDACAALTGPYWIVLCGKTKSCGARDSYCESDDDDPSPSYARERIGYEISAVVGERPSHICGCLEDSAHTADDSKCQCVSPESECYKKHYEGECECDCGKEPKCDCSCECKCVLLAKVTASDDPEKPWFADHRVRRFVRPVLMRDKTAVAPPKTGNNGTDGTGGTDVVVQAQAADAGAVNLKAESEKLRAENKALQEENQRLKDAAKANEALTKNPDVPLWPA